ncbi:MAG: lactate utilization protein B/C [Bacteroidetes bacterium]|nr:MAG: lactate utilization protein B/C [Bacteroidota bacterium]
MSSNVRLQILKKINFALLQSTPRPFVPDESGTETYVRNDAELDLLFAETFTRLQGNFSYCLNTAEMVHQMTQLATHKAWDKWFCGSKELRLKMEQLGWQLPWHNDLASCNVAITGCESLVARTGSMVLSSAASSGRTASVYAPAHICVAYSHQLVYDISDALSLLQQKYPGPKMPSLISFASGPSRTADIEKTLVTGVHGPKEVFCFLIDA